MNNLMWDKHGNVIPADAEEYPNTWFSAPKGKYRKFDNIGHFLSTKFFKNAKWMKIDEDCEYQLSWDGDWIKEDTSNLGEFYIRRKGNIVEFTIYKTCFVERYSCIICADFKDDDIDFVYGCNYEKRKQKAYDSVASKRTM